MNCRSTYGSQISPLCRFESAHPGSGASPLLLRRKRAKAFHVGCRIGVDAYSELAKENSFQGRLMKLPGAFLRRKRFHKARASLEQAMRKEDPEGFEAALNRLVGQECCDLMIRALAMDWHFRHEDVVQAIQIARCREAVPALEARALNAPAYLVWDDNHALARKCTWALADIGTPDARAALERLAVCDAEKVRVFAKKRLNRWADELHRKIGGSEGQ